MVLSLHSHSGQFCKHAKGTLEAVVKTAIKKGFQVYGLSEHMPRLNVEDLYPEESHLSVDELGACFHDFVAEACRLQDKYGSDIKLLIGMETEWIIHNNEDPSFHIKQLLDKYPRVQYIVGSVHHASGKWLDFDKDRFDQAVEYHGGLHGLFSTYLDHQFDMVSKLKPEVVGHFDLVKMFCPAEPWLDEHLQKISRNIEFIASYGGLIEINSRGWKKGYGAYPARELMHIMKEKGCKFTLSDDSHGPDDVGMHYDKLRSYLIEFEIDTVYYPGGKIENIAKVI